MTTRDGRECAEVHAATISERDSDDAFPTEFAVRSGRRNEEVLFQGFGQGSRLATFSLIATAALVAFIALVVWSQPRFGPDGLHFF